MCRLLVPAGCFGGGEGGLLCAGCWSLLAVWMGLREVCCVQAVGPCWLCGWG